MIDEIMIWGSTAGRYRLAADSPFRQTLAHTWYQLYHITSVFCCRTPQIQHPEHLLRIVICSLHLPDITNIYYTLQN